MSNEKLAAERDLFEAEVCKSSEMTGHGEGYSQLALQRRGDGNYSTTWVRGAWMGWQMGRAAAMDDAIGACEDVIAEADRNSESAEEMGARRCLMAVQKMSEVRKGE